MLRSVILFLFMCIVGIAQVYGQSVSGQVQTADHKPLPFVSVALLRDTGFITGGIANDAGVFRLHSKLTAGVQYKLKLSLIGYQTLEQSFTWPDTALLKKLVLVRGEKLLGEVVVASR